MEAYSHMLGNPIEHFIIWSHLYTCVVLLNVQKVLFKQC